MKMKDLRKGFVNLKISMQIIVAFKTRQIEYLKDDLRAEKQRKSCDITVIIKYHCQFPKEHDNSIY